MQVTNHWQTFTFGDTQTSLFIPDAVELQQWYQKQNNKAFPYWARLWPAAKALTSFLALKPEWIKDKNILELGAGLGLPSLFAARHAKKVICSDASGEAVEVMTQSIKAVSLTNIQALTLNWNYLPDYLQADVLLLSDVNYSTDDFSQLMHIIKQFLSQETTIIISTPQRLMAKVFVDDLLPFLKFQTEFTIKEDHENTYCSVYLL